MGDIGPAQGVPFTIVLVAIPLWVILEIVAWIIENKTSAEHPAAKTFMYLANAVGIIPIPAIVSGIILTSKFSYHRNPVILPTIYGAIIGSIILWLYLMIKFPQAQRYRQEAARIFAILVLITSAIIGIMLLF